MKIIDNKKDYYDYLSGIYGIDPVIVYDRRGSENVLDTWGSLKDIFKDNVGLDSFGKPIKHRDILVEAGLKKIICRIHYNGNSVPDFEILESWSIQKEEKLGKSPVSVFLGSWYSKSRYSFYKSSELTEPWKNYIWKDTWLPKIVPAETMWQGLYDYFSALKDPKIVDSRNDIQKIESHGFDKKTSFRNIK